MAVLTELGALPPPGFVVDVGVLLEGASFDTSQAAALGSAHLMRTLSHYDDRVLGRIAGDRRLMACQDAYARLDAAKKPAAVGVFVASLARQSSALRSFEPGPLRQLLRMPGADLAARIYDAWREAGASLESLVQGYEGLVQVGRSVPAWITDADVFTLEHLDVLGAMGQRLAVSQIVNAAEAMASRWPRRIKLRRPEEGVVPTSLEDESAYPAGGFTAMANHGALENLVTSELVYMDRRSDPSGIDLFDVRYAEGELLYYTRDEAVIVRPRRVVAFVLCPSLAAARIKDVGVSWQRIVVLLAWVLAAVRSLERWLGDAELSFLCIVETADQRSAALDQEAQLLELVLSEWRDKGVAEVVTLSQPAWHDVLRERARRADVRVAVLGELAPSDPSVGINPWIAVGLDNHARDWDTWCALGLSILRTLAS
jgi:hypothetical protein